MKNQYSVLSIDTLLDQLHGTKYFIEIDLQEVFHLLCIWEEDKWKMVFRMPFGLFEFLIMPFELCNTPALFQSYIDQALQGLEDELIAYLDKILILGSTLEKLYI